MNKTDARALFSEMHPGFFEREYIQEMAEDLTHEELILRLDDFDPTLYDKSFDSSVSFGIFSGDRAELIEAVREVEDGWAKYYGEGSRALCGYIDGKIAAFCLVEDMGEHTIDGKSVRIGGPGCVGTLPCYRNRGIGLMMVKMATQILKDEGYAYSYIHYTGVGDWYRKLGYETLLTWTKNGIL